MLYKPIRPKIPEDIYVITAMAKNTAGVRPALKIFLLSLCDLNWLNESSISCESQSGEFS